MRAFAAGMLMVAVALIAAADDRAPSPRVEAIVAVPPTEHQRLHYFGRRHHHLVPGTVTINGATSTASASSTATPSWRTSARRASPARMPGLLLVRDDRSTSRASKWIQRSS